MPIRKKRVYTYRTTHGRRADAKTAIIIILCALAMLGVALLIVFLGDRAGGGGASGRRAHGAEPAGIFRR